MPRKNLSCPLESTLEVLAGRWRVLLIRELFADQPRRFNDLQRSLVGISHHILSRELRALERQGIVQRTAYAETPPRVEYILTPTGRTLEPLLAAMASWGREHGFRTAAQG